MCICAPLRNEVCGNTGRAGFLSFLCAKAVCLPKFYVNFRYRDRVSIDDQGIDLPNLAAAVDVAIQAAIELVDEALNHNGSAIPDAMIVGDQDGKTLATISIADVLIKKR